MSTKASTSNGAPQPAASPSPPASEGAKQSAAAAAAEAPKKRKLGPRDFRFSTLLGEGSYAKVYLATRKEGGREFAAKIVDKAHVIRHKKTQTVMREKKVLSMCDHPNIVHLHCAFQDKYSFYFLLEFVHGGELFELIQRLERLDVALARVYTAEIVSMLEYLHGRGVLHRDLKPENILIAKDRHLKLTDFGTAGLLRAGESKLAGGQEQFVGSADYVSPEVLDGKEQGKACDLWSVGCIVYHMLVGKPPFRGQSEYLTFQNILKGEPKYPADMPADAKDLLQKLLVRDPESRIGARDMGELKAHTFFKGIDWASLPTTEIPRWQEPDASGGLSTSKLGQDPDSDDDIVPAKDGAAGSSYVSQPETRLLDLKGRTSKCAIETQKVLDEHAEWKRFLIDRESVFYTGPIMKRSFRGIGILAKKRQLILTTFPRILYVDPARMQLKGEIPWSDSLVAEQLSRKHLVIYTRKKRYNITCLSHKADGWVSAIRKLKAQLASGVPAVPESKAGARPARPAR